MKIHPISSTYIISLPFKYNSEKGKLFHIIMGKEMIVSGIKKTELECVEIRTTKADAIYTPKNIRVEVDSRYMSLEKLQKLLKKVLFEIDVLFNKSNISNTKKFLKEFTGFDDLM